MKRLLLLAATCCALLVPGNAGAATIVNGDFETGNLSGWTVFNSTSKGNWFPYAGTQVPFANPEEQFFAPPQGNWAAVTSETSPDLAILFQDVTLEPFWTHNLSLIYYYRSFAPIAIPTPYTLDITEELVKMAEPPLGEDQENQQLRIDVIKPTAPIDTVNPAEILTTIFANKVGDPQVIPPTTLSADLTQFAGQTVRLRIANAVNEEVFNAAVDAVTLTSTPPSNVFTKGKLQLNKKKGTAKLAINVPGAGVLKIANGGKGKKAPKLIKAATKNPTKAGKVWVPIKPTGTGKATLTEDGKLQFKVKVTFTPTGGTAATKTFGGKLKLND
ncbi:MAG TPA: hypothetical protein VFB52_14135 [Solirubrobacterales bacterium]|nr:hypothetical protein [Solirubrobacterales bacterium]